MKIQKDEAGFRIQQQIAERVEHAVSWIIGNFQSDVVHCLHQSGHTSTMGSIRSAGVVCRGNEERVRPVDRVQLQLSENHTAER